VSICHNEARLVPRATASQKPSGTRLTVEPSASALVEERDYFGNVVHFFTLEEAHLRLSVTAQSEVELVPYEPPALALSPAWESVRDGVRNDLTLEGLRALEYTLESPHVRISEDLVAYAAPSFSPGRPLLEAVYDLTRRIYGDFKYEPGSTTVATPVHEVLA